MRRKTLDTTALWCCRVGMGHTGSMAMTPTPAAARRLCHGGTMRVAIPAPRSWRPSARCKLQEGDLRWASAHLRPASWPPCGRLTAGRRRYAPDARSAAPGAKARAWRGSIAGGSGNDPRVLPRDVVGRLPHHPGSAVFQHVHPAARPKLALRVIPKSSLDGGDPLGIGPAAPSRIRASVLDQPYDGVEGQRCSICHQGVELSNQITTCPCALSNRSSRLAPAIPAAAARSRDSTSRAHLESSVRRLSSPNTKRATRPRGSGKGRGRVATL